MTLGALITLAAVTVGTWNGEWFPSGRAEHRASPEQEAATIGAAGRMLRDALAKADPGGTNDLILCFNEIRGPLEAKALCAELGRTNLTVAVITGYRRRDRFDQQQDVIATTLPVASASWSKWKEAGRETPPRGYAKASVLFSPAVTGTVYAIHLKSNYGQTTEELVRINRAKRTRAIDQLIAQEKPRRGKKAQPPLVIAGDLNADKWAKAFAKETIFSTLEQAGFDDPLETLPSDRRITHPGKGKWGNSALDYILLRGIRAAGPPVIVPAEGLSDHNPVFVTLEISP